MRGSSLSSSCQSQERETKERALGERMGEKDSERDEGENRRNRWERII